MHKAIGLYNDGDECVWLKSAAICIGQEQIYIKNLPDLMFCKICHVPSDYVMMTTRVCGWSDLHKICRFRGQKYLSQILNTNIWVLKYSVGHGIICSNIGGGEEIKMEKIFPSP